MAISLLDGGRPVLDGRFIGQLPDGDPALTAEWLDSLDDLIAAQGESAVRLVLAKLLRRAAEHNVDYPATVTTPYVNTISPSEETSFPGDEEIERRIEALDPRLA